MKPWMLAAITAFTTSSYACCAPFTGFYLGSEVGVIHYDIHNHVRQNYTSNNPNDLIGINFINESVKQGDSDWLLGAYLGYGKCINGFYLGAEIDAFADNAFHESTDSYIGSDNQFHYFRHRFERDISVGIAPRLGFIFNCSWMVYGKIAANITQFRVEHFSPETSIATPNMSITYTASPIFTRTKTIVALAPSIGIEKQVCNALIRLEYGYDFGGKIDQQVQYDKFGITEEDVFNYHTLDRHSLEFEGQFVKIGVAFLF